MSSIQDKAPSSEDRRVITETLPLADVPEWVQAERAVIQASRRLYDADLRCRQAEKGSDYMAMRRAEQSKAKAVEAWREAMRALRETDPD